MTHLAGHDRSQTLLLPEALDDSVGPDNPVRFIEAFVDGSISWAMLAELERTGEDQISLTDPDSRAMAAYTHVAVGYDVQVAVNTRHKLIVKQQVTNQILDMGLLTPTAEPAQEVLGVEQIAVVASGRPNMGALRGVL
jgi:hypothetical protein